jgi:hypothetical protein
LMENEYTTHSSLFLGFMGEVIPILESQSSMLKHHQVTLLPRKDILFEPFDILV